MSVKLDATEFSRAADRATRTCMPADSRAQQAWLGDWQTAVERMKYLQIEHSGISESLRHMIRIRGKLRKPNLSLELIKPDVEALWSEISNQAQEAVHSIHNTESGFECSFLAVTNNAYITGSVVILRTG